MGKSHHWKVKDGQESPLEGQRSECNFEQISLEFLTEQ